jgi:hypothetical protein
MSASTMQNSGPAIGDTVHELRGVFASDAALQEAIGRLTRAGFDRADLSLPDASPAPGLDTPEQGASNPNTDDDNRQVRTLQTSMAGSVGALAAAGAVIATGGAALPAIAAAAAVGVGVGGLVNASGTAGVRMAGEARDDAATRGELALSVRIGDAAKQGQAEAELLAAGAYKVTKN